MQQQAKKILTNTQEQIMCSNTSSTSGAGVSGGGGGGGDGDYASILLKRPKRQRVPKRGPGVAELEKILREQENKNHTDKGNVSFATDHNHHWSPPPPPITMLYNNGCGRNNYVFSGGGNGGNNGVRIGGSGILLPEQTLLPTIWSSCESSICEEAPKIPDGYPFSTDFVHGSDQMRHSPLVLQKKHLQYPSPMINLFPHSGSLSSISDDPPAGFYLHLEPPSNQRSSHHIYSSMLPEEDKMAGTKRPWTFSVENNSAPPMFHCQVSSPFSQIRTLDHSLSSCNHGTAFNLGRDDTVARDHAKKFIPDYGAVTANNFLMFGSPATAPSPLIQTSQQELSRCSSLPLQESNGGSHQMSSHGGSVHKKPFYSFLIPEEQTGGEETPTLCLDSTERGDGSRRDAVDLNLKL